MLFLSIHLLSTIWTSQLFILYIVLRSQSFCVFCHLFSPLFFICHLNIHYFQITKKGHFPSARCGAVMTVYKNKGLFFGGVLDDEGNKMLLSVLFHFFHVFILHSCSFPIFYLSLSYLS